MTPETGEAGPLGAAVHRLDRALAQLEVRINALSDKASGASGELFDHDRARLAAALDASRGRERDLETAGALASQALGRAIAEIRAALGEDEFSEADSADDVAEEDL